MEALRGWLVAFLLTQAVEVPIYRRLLAAPWWAALAASALTHPLVWFGFFSPALPMTYVQRVVAAELFAWLAEALWFVLALGRPPRRALLVSLAANGASLTAGLLWHALDGAY